MGTDGGIILYTFLGLGMALVIFIAALVFVNSARRGNRRFKWGSAERQTARREPTADRVPGAPIPAPREDRRG